MPDTQEAAGTTTEQAPPSPEEPPQATPEVAPAPTVEVRPAPAPPEIDLSGYDMAITEAKKNLEMVAEDEIGTVKTRIRELEAQKAEAKARHQTTELNFYKEQALSATFKEAAPDINPGDLPESLGAEERLQVARMMQGKMDAVKKQAKATDADNQAQISQQALSEAHRIAGAPIVPERDAPTPDEMETVNTAVAEGDLSKIGQTSHFKEVFKNMGNVLSRR